MANDKKHTVRQLQADERVDVFAASDIPDFKLAQTGPIAAKGEKISKGESQLVFRIDAREMCRSGEWTMSDPTKGAASQAQQLLAAETSFKLVDVPGISAATARAIEEAGYGELQALREATVDDLVGVKGVGTKYARSILVYVEESYPHPALMAAPPAESDDGAAAARIVELEADNADLKEQVGDLSDKMDRLLVAMEAQGSTPAAGEE